MFYLNKFVGAICNPLWIGLLLFCIGAFLLWKGKRKTGFVAVLLAFLWFCFWGSSATFQWLGGRLEKEYPILRAEQLPRANAIVILGGGVGSCPSVSPYPELYSGADRVLFAARLYKAGRAPLVIPTGEGEATSSVPFLRDLGVPAADIRVEENARNTEENARFVCAMLKGSKTPTILLVTSAWHMRRSILNFEKQGLQVIPAATDYEATVEAGQLRRIGWWWPTAEFFSKNSYIYKEYLGYWLYRLKYSFREEKKS
jgi:uncharacterized SAM-binding protein YcdF (DUF218 family)